MLRAAYLVSVIFVLSNFFFSRCCYGQTSSFFASSRKIPGRVRWRVDDLTFSLSLSAPLADGYNRSSYYAVDFWLGRTIVLQNPTGSTKGQLRMTGSKRTHRPRRAKKPDRAPRLSHQTLRTLESKMDKWASGFWVNVRVRARPAPDLLTNIYLFLMTFFFYCLNLYVGV